MAMGGWQPATTVNSNIVPQQNPITPVPQIKSQNYINMKNQESSGSEFTGPSSIDYNDSNKTSNTVNVTNDKTMDGHKFKPPNPVDSPSSAKKSNENKEEAKKTPSSKLLSKVLPKNKGKKKSKRRKDSDEEWVADDNDDDDDNDADSSDEEDPYNQTRVKVKPTFKDTRSKKKSQKESKP